MGLVYCRDPECLLLIFRHPRNGVEKGAQALLLGASLASAACPCPPSVLSTQLGSPAAHSGSNDSGSLREGQTESGFIAGVFWATLTLLVA